MRPLTPADAKALKRGDVIYDAVYATADGAPWRWRVNGAVTRWKRQPERFRVPIKRGLFEFGYVTEKNYNEFAVED